MSCVELCFHWPSAEEEAGARALMLNIWSLLTSMVTLPLPQKLVQNLFVLLLPQTLTGNGTYSSIFFGFIHTSNVVNNWVVFPSIELFTSGGRKHLDKLQSLSHILSKFNFTKQTNKLTNKTYQIYFGW